MLNHVSVHLLPFAFIMVVVLMPASAAAAVLSLDVELGFSGRFQLGKWTPVTIFIENRGRPVTGQLEIIVTSGSEYRGDVHRVTYARTVELPYQSRKRFSFIIRIESVTHRMIVRLQKAETTMVSRSINLKPFFTTKELGIVSGIAISPDFLSALPASVFPVVVRPEFYPDIWYGYHGVKVAIVSADMLMRLSEKQFQALEDWIANGGYLIAASSINYGPLLQERTSRLLPVKVRGHRSFFELNALSAFCGETIVSKDPFLVLDAEVENSRVLIKEDNLPLISQRDMGIGKILFLAFDFMKPPFSRWKLRRTLWEHLLSLGPSQALSDVKIPDGTIRKALLSTMPSVFPSFRTISVLLVFYVVVMGFGYHKLKHRAGDKPKFAGYIVLFIAAFTGVVYAAFIYSNRKKNLTYNSFSHIIYHGQDSMASIEQVIGLYSIKATPYEVRFGPEFLPIRPLWVKNKDNRIPNSYLFYDNNETTWLAGYAQRWSSNFFIIESSIGFPVFAQVLEDEKGFTILIQNRTAHDIKACWGYVRGHYFSLGDIFSNTKDTWRIRASQLVNKENMNQRTTDHWGELSANLMEAVHLNYQSKPDTMCLVGWISPGPLPVTVDPSDHSGKNMTLVQWAIPVGAAGFMSLSETEQSFGQEQRSNES
ncbi:MAG: hypothetical protein JRJ04_07420 [Deltaproteobacteria bacterium]|nr:hypothetical protein [Deltaproteobacteria bacterium]